MDVINVYLSTLQCTTEIFSLTVIRKMKIICLTSFDLVRCSIHDTIIVKSRLNGNDRETKTRITFNFFFDKCELTSQIIRNFLRRLFISSALLISCWASQIPHVSVRVYSCRCRHHSCVYRSSSLFIYLLFSSFGLPLHTPHTSYSKERNATRKRVRKVINLLLISCFDLRLMSSTSDSSRHFSV